MTMKSRPFQKRLVDSIRNHRRQLEGAGNTGIYADMVKKLPVTPKDNAKKSALIKELESMEKQCQHMARRLTSAADALERLSVESALIDRGL